MGRIKAYIVKNLTIIECSVSWDGDDDWNDMESDHDVLYIRSDDLDHVYHGRRWKFFTASEAEKQVLENAHRQAVKLLEQLSNWDEYATSCHAELDEELAIKKSTLESRLVRIQAIERSE